MADRKSGRFAVKELGTIVNIYRRMKGLSLREAAKESGTSASTLMRCEQGKSLDFNNLDAITRWLGLEITCTPRREKSDATD